MDRQARILRAADNGCMSAIMHGWEASGTLIPNGHVEVLLMKAMSVGAVGQREH